MEKETHLYDGKWMQQFNQNVSELKVGKSWIGSQWMHPG